jgi:hypothetical protein
MAKLIKAVKKLTENFSEFVFERDTLIEKSYTDYEHTLEEAKIRSYEMRRHTF